MKGLFLLASIALATAAFGQSTNQEEKVRLLQVSLVPSIPPSMGVYHVSLNLFAGYNNGIRGVELGSFANINDGMVKGVQYSGFTNVTHGSVTGMQASGFANVSTSDVKGTQMSGFYNHSHELTGAQFSGFANVAIGMVRGGQVSGFANVVTDEMAGVQLASFANYAEDVKGAQVSGFVNRARKLNGVQVGIINIADTVEHGATIGLINIVKKGMINGEIEYNDVLTTTASFKSGTSRLYGILSFGFRPDEDDLWGFGAGFGTQQAINEKFFLNLEATSFNLDKPWESNHYNQLIRVAVGGGYKPFGTLAVISGPVLNILIHEDDALVNRLNSQLVSNPFYEKSSNNNNLKMWLGYRFAVRF